MDLAARSDLLDAYDDAITLQTVPHLVVDLSRVTFMDSTGLGTLVAALNQATARGGTLSVAGASARIAHLLHITQLDTVVTLLPEAAVALEP